jgi:hypothetical protein
LKTESGRRDSAAPNCHHHHRLLPGHEPPRPCSTPPGRCRAREATCKATIKSPRRPRRSTLNPRPRSPTAAVTGPARHHAASASHPTWHTRHRPSPPFTHQPPVLLVAQPCHPACSRAAHTPGSPGSWVLGPGSWGRSPGCRCPSPACMRAAAIPAAVAASRPSGPLNLASTAPLPTAAPTQHGGHTGAHSLARTGAWRHPPALLPPTSFQGEGLVQSRRKCSDSDPLDKVSIYI